MALGAITGKVQVGTDPTTGAGADRPADVVSRTPKSSDPLGPSFLPDTTGGPSSRIANVSTAQPELVPPGTRVGTLTMQQGASRGAAGTLCLSQGYCDQPGALVASRSMSRNSIFWAGVSGDVARSGSSEPGVGVHLDPGVGVHVSFLGYNVESTRDAQGRLVLADEGAPTGAMFRAQGSLSQGRVKSLNANVGLGVLFRDGLYLLPTAALDYDYEPGLKSIVTTFGVEVGQQFLFDDGVVYLGLFGGAGNLTQCLSIDQKGPFGPAAGGTINARLGAPDEAGTLLLSGSVKLLAGPVARTSLTADVNVWRDHLRLGAGINHMRTDGDTHLWPFARVMVQPF